MYNYYDFSQISKFQNHLFILDTSNFKIWKDAYSVHDYWIGHLSLILESDDLFREKLIFSYRDENLFFETKENEQNTKFCKWR